MPDFKFRGSIQLMDYQNERTTLGYRKTITAADAATARNAMETFMTDVKDAVLTVSDATVTEFSFTHVLGESNLRPAAGTDVAVEAVVMAHLNDPTEAEKLVALRIPAPNASIFKSDGRILDEVDASVQAWIAEMLPFEWSDGESIDPDSGANGIKAGWYRTRSRSARN